MIDKFDGKYFYLSNFFEIPVVYNGLKFLNNEAAFQAQKTLDNDLRIKFTTLNPSAAKRLGRSVTLRKDWEKVKSQIMYEICDEKFKQHEDLRRALIDTGTEELIEGNTWGDKTWGKVNGVGENRLGKILMELREKYSCFDPQKVTNELINWIKKTFEENGKGCKAIVGISGGKDSTVVASLCANALGKENVIGVLMPNGEQKDIEDAYSVVKYLDINSIEVNIEKAVKGVLAGITGAFNAGKSNIDPQKFVFTKQALLNLDPRIRMATLYFVSQCNNGRVMNTCNLSEDFVGYSTRYGDSAGDFSPLSHLTSEEVVKIGEYLGIPDNLIHKVPSDGLCGATDEENLGFTYNVLNRYIRTGICEDKDIEARIDMLHEKNMFKLSPMPSYEYYPYYKGERTTN